MSLILQEFIPVYCLVNIPFNLHLEFSKASVMLVSVGSLYREPVQEGMVMQPAISDSDAFGQLFLAKGYLFCILSWTKGRTCRSHESEARVSLT